MLKKNKEIKKEMAAGIDVAAPSSEKEKTEFCCISQLPIFPGKHNTPWMVVLVYDLFINIS